MRSGNMATAIMAAAASQRQRQRGGHNPMPDQVRRPRRAPTRYTAPARQAKFSA